MTSGRSRNLRFPCRFVAVDRIAGFLKYRSSDITEGVVEMNITKKKISVIFIALVCVLSVCAMFMPFTVSADDYDKSITLNCTKDGTILDGMEWKIYRVGERSGGDFVLTGDFASYPVDIKDMSAENIIAAAQTLDGYSTADKIPVLASGVTNASGTLTFNGLNNGLYMAVGKRITKDIYTYIPSPLLLEVSNGQTEFNFDAYPKIVRAALSDKATSHTVRKIWLDYNDTYEARPTYVTVDLFRDGELYDTVTLNEANDWQHKWVSLGNEYDWKVVERKIPVDYEVRIEYNETQYLIRNRHKTVMDWDEVTRPITTTTGTTTTLPPVVTGSDVDSSTETTHTAAELTSTTSTTMTTAVSTLPPTSAQPPQSTYTGGGRSKLPQTGQLWWPVAPLGLGGTLMVFTGMKLRSKKDEDEE